MGLPIHIKNFLQETSLPYEVLRHQRTITLAQAAEACQLSLDQLVRAVVLIDAEGPLMAILPADHMLDFEALCKLLNRNLELVPGQRLADIFDDCEPGSFPPLATVYGLDVIIDSSIEDKDAVVFEPGSHTSLIRMTVSDFKTLYKNIHTAHISQPASSLSNLQEEITNDHFSSFVEQLTPTRLEKNIEEFRELPALPATAAQILQMASNPLANARQLAEVIEQDPAIAAQVLRYANSSLYGYAGRIKDLQTAIARVLGFEFVLNLALGLTIGKSLRIPPDGPFGLNTFWRQSVYAARLVELLARQLPSKLRPQRGTAYLAGLIQNIGRLALGHVFQAEFFILNQFVQANPDMSPCELEKNVLGVTHDQIGAWLMEAWGMPDELVIAVRHHHDQDYWDSHSTYPQLVLIANRALAGFGMSDVETSDLPAFSMDMLGLKETTVRLLTEQILANGDELNDLAKRMAA